jgi:hypothetical protein
MIGWTCRGHPNVCEALRDSEHVFRSHGRLRPMHRCTRSPMWICAFAKRSKLVIAMLRSLFGIRRRSRCNRQICRAPAGCGGMVLVSLEASIVLGICRAIARGRNPKTQQSGFWLEDCAGWVPRAALILKSAAARDVRTPLGQSLITLRDDRSLREAWLTTRVAGQPARATSVSARAISKLSITSSSTSLCVSPGHFAASRTL